VNAVFTVADCELPPVAVTVAANAFVLVSAKFAEPTPETVALMLYDPAVPFAVAVTPATPALFVTTVLLERLALAPEAGAANVTVTPGTGLPPASMTVACSEKGNGVLVVVDCPLPAVAEIVAAGPFVFVSTKAGEAEIPGTEAVML
jgi:hypothetical protein